MTFVPASFALQMPLAERSHARMHICIYARACIRAGNGEKDDEEGRRRGRTVSADDRRRESFGFADDDDRHDRNFARSFSSCITIDGDILPPPDLTASVCHSPTKAYFRAA